MKIGRFVSLRAFVKKVKGVKRKMKKLYSRFSSFVVFLPFESAALKEDYE